MTAHATRADLSVAEPIAAFAEESLDRHGIDRAAFWAGVSGLVHELAPRNAELLRARDDLQTRIDDYHRAAPGTPDPAAYRAFLTEIGYLRPEPASVAASTADVAPEIARLAGLQPVVPILNARFALNAAKRPLGLPLRRALRYRRDPARGRPRSGFLLQHDAGRRRHRPRSRTPRHRRPARLRIPRRFDGVRGARRRARRGVRFGRRGRYSRTPLRSSATRAHRKRRHRSCSRTTACTSGDLDRPFRSHRFHRRRRSAGHRARVGAHDDHGSRGLGRRGRRRGQGARLPQLARPDGRHARRTRREGRRDLRPFDEPSTAHTAPGGGANSPPGRSVLFVRNVGHLMRGDSILDRDGREVPEGIVDAIMTALGSLDDLRGDRRQLGTGSVYIVKPKMHRS